MRSHVWMCHILHIGMSHITMKHHSFHICFVWDTIHSTYAQWFHVCEMISNVWNYFTHETYETRFFSHMWNDFRCVKWFQMCEIISHMSRMRHDSLHICEMISDVWNDFKCVKLFHIWVAWDTTHFTYGTWCIYKWDKTWSYTRHDSFLCVFCDTTYSYVTTHVDWFHIWVNMSPVTENDFCHGTWLTHTQDTTHFYICSATELVLMWHDSCWLISHVSQQESCHTRMSCVS